MKNPEKQRIPANARVFGSHTFVSAIYIRAFKLCTLCVVRLFNDRNLFDLLIVAVSIVYASERSVFGCINLTDCFSFSEVLNSLI